jgi:autotransporter translocation and assembly factor TamB
VCATDVDLAALPVAVEPLTGTFRGTIDATGPLAEPAQGQASATIERFEGSWNRQPFTVTSPSRLQYANERLDIEHLELAAGDSSLVVSGALPLTDRAGRGEIAIEGHANLATLAQYLPAGTDLTGDGAVTVAGTLRGTLTAIDPDLVLNVDDGLVLSRQIEPGLSNIHLRARVMNGVADVEQLTANWGSASIDASGRIPLEAVPPLPVEIPRMGGPATFEASVRDLDPAARLGLLYLRLFNDLRQ